MSGCPPHTHCLGASEFRDASSSWNLISPGSCSPLTSAHSRENQEPRLKLARRSPSLLDAGPRLDPGGLCSCLGSLCWISGPLSKGAEVRGSEGFRDPSSELSPHLTVPWAELTLYYSPGPPARITLGVLSNILISGAPSQAN